MFDILDVWRACYVQWWKKNSIFYTLSISSICGGVAPRMDSQNRRRVFHSTIFGYKIFWKFSVGMFVTEISNSKFLPPPPMYAPRK